MQKLAIKGGPRAVPENLELPTWPIVTEADIDAFKRVIASNRFSGILHPEIISFEEEYAEHVGMKYCVAFNSGTSALHGCVAGVGVEPGDEVLVPALTFLASATAVLHHNAIPVFVDIDPRTFNIDAAKIEDRITDRTKAIMAVDYHGLPADYEEVYAVARKHGLVVIEDGSQAHGAVYKGRKIGSLGDICGSSIMPGKTLPAGSEGGVVTTNNENYRDMADLLRMFGEIITPEQEREYNAYSMGWNYRMSPFGAAMARSQLERYESYTKLRQAKAAYISKGLSELPGIIPPYIPEGYTHAYYLYYISTDPRAAGIDVAPGAFRQALQEILRAEGVLVRLSQRTPIPGQVLFQMKRGYGKGCPWNCKHNRDVEYRIEDYPVTLDVIQRCMGLDVRYFHPHSPISTQDLVLDGFRKVFEHLEEVREYASKLDYAPPWEGLTQLPPKLQAVEYVRDAPERGIS